MKTAFVVKSCNVDKLEYWPIELPGVPRVGDFVQSRYKWFSPDVKHEFLGQLELEVSKITWKTDDNFYVEIELVIPISPDYFYEDYKKLCGKNFSDI